MVDNPAPIPIIATVRDAIEATAEINRGVGREEQRQRWYRDPKLWTMLVPLILSIGGMFAWTVSYYQAAKDRGDAVTQQMDSMKSELSILVNMKPQLDIAVRDETRLEAAVAINHENETKRLDIIEKDWAGIREQILQRLAVQETRVETLLSEVRDVNTELHHLNQQHSQIITPQPEMTVERTPFIPLNGLR